MILSAKSGTKDRNAQYRPYLGFFSKKSAEIYYDIVRAYLDHAVPLDKTLEEVTLGEYKMYLNHGDRAVRV